MSDPRGTQVANDAAEHGTPAAANRSFSGKVVAIAEQARRAGEDALLSRRRTRSARHIPTKLSSSAAARSKAIPHNVAGDAILSNARAARPHANAHASFANGANADTQAGPFAANLRHDIRRFPTKQPRSFQRLARRVKLPVSAARCYRTGSRENPRGRRDTGRIGNNQPRFGERLESSVHLHPEHRTASQAVTRQRCRDDAGGMRAPSPRQGRHRGRRLLAARGALGTAAGPKRIVASDGGGKG